MNNETKLWQGLLAQAWMDKLYTRAQVLKTSIEHNLDFDEVESLFKEMAGL